MMDRSNPLPLSVHYTPLTIRHILWHVCHFSSLLYSLSCLFIQPYKCTAHAHAAIFPAAHVRRRSFHDPVKRSTIFMCLSNSRPSIVLKASHGVSERAIRPRGFALPRNFPACAASRPQTGRKPRVKLTRNGANQR